MNERAVFMYEARDVGHVITKRHAFFFSNLAKRLHFVPFFSRRPRQIPLYFPHCYSAPQPSIESHVLALPLVDGSLGFIFPLNV
jgi:hypothetical protein